MHAEARSTSQPAELHVVDGRMRGLRSSQLLERLACVEYSDVDVFLHLGQGAQSRRLVLGTKHAMLA
jgi:hypothetical protein